MRRFNRDDYNNNYDRGDFSRENNNFDRSYDAREYSRDYNREPYNNGYDSRDMRNDPARPYQDVPPVDNRQGGYNRPMDNGYRDNRYNGYQNNGRDNGYNRHEEPINNNYNGSYPNNSYNQEAYYYNNYNAKDVSKSDKSWADSNVKNMVVCSPKDYKDIQNLINNLKNKQALIVNVDGLPDQKVQRFLDFLSGAIYALGGSCQRLDSAKFLFAPQGVSITIPYDIKQKNMKDDK